jgi:hypothetical protein
LTSWLAAIFATVVTNAATEELAWMLAVSGALAGYDMNSWTAWRTTGRRILRSVEVFLSAAVVRPFFLATSNL